MAIVTADSYGIDNTGATDVTTALSTAINAQPAGTTFQLHANGSYRSDSQKIWSNSNGIIVDGQNAAIFESVRRTGVPQSANPTEGTLKTLSITGSNMEIRNLRLYGFRKDAYTGNYLVAESGSPTFVSTTVQLDAANEAVRLPQVPLDTLTSSINYETPFYFRDKDGYVRFEIQASDTAHVAGDAEIAIIDDDTDVELTSQAFTLTGSVATYQLAWFLTDPYLGTRLRIVARKATATSNVITIASITAYGEAGYRPYDWFGNATNPPYSGGDEFSHHFYPSGNNIIIRDCYSEGCDGDSYNFGTSNSAQVIDSTSRGAGRQGMVMQRNTGTIVDGYMCLECGRSGIDLEPNTGADNVYDPIIRNCTFDEIRNFAIGSSHPTQVFNMNISNIVSTNCGMGPFYGGAVGGSITNWVHSGTYRPDADRVLNGGLTDSDALLFWQGCEVDGFTTDIGFALQSKGSTIYRDMHVRGAVVTNPRPPSYRLFLDSMGTAPTGQVWTDGVGTWNIDAGKAYLLTTAVANSYTSVETLMADAVLEADIAFGASGSQGGFVFRMLDTANYLQVRLAAPATMNVYQRVGDVLTAIGTSPYTIPTITNTTVHLKVVALGSTLQIYTAGVLRATITNATNLTNTRCGLFANSPVARFENFSVVAA